ncbi:MAG: HEAT repeat domain-containing protein [Acidobacteriota bacterium]|nr:HEAT repeat domain-containing protein [Acidobacteriota bacterium]
MKRLADFALIIFSLLSLLNAAATAARAEIYTSPDGHRFEVNLIPDKPEIIVGEPIYLSFEVKNLSDVDLGILDGGDYRNRLGRPLSFSIKAVRDDGSEVPVPEINISMGGLISYRKAPKNGKHTFRLFLPLWAPFTEPGNYKISCRKNLKINDYRKADFSGDTFEKMWSGGVPVNLETALKVLPKDYEKMGKVIKFREAQLKSSDTDEAVKALIFIEDKRIIDPLISVSGFNSAALLRLAHFDDEKAFQAITAQLYSNDRPIRFSAVEALSDSRHPRAAEYILKMKDDEDKMVRLRVMQFLGKTGTPETLKLLREMLLEERNKEWERYVKQYLEKEKE